jgi:hypothetical protein
MEPRTNIEDDYDWATVLWLLKTPNARESLEFFIHRRWRLLNAGYRQEIETMNEFARIKF